MICGARRALVEVTATHDPRIAAHIEVAVADETRARLRRVHVRRRCGTGARVHARHLGRVQRVDRVAERLSVGRLVRLQHPDLAPLVEEEEYAADPGRQHYHHNDHLVFFHTEPFRLFVRIGMYRTIQTCPRKPARI